MGIQEFLHSGGFLVILLFSLSFISLALAFERVLVYFSVSNNLKDLTDRDSEEIKSAAEYDATIVEHWLNRLLATCNDPEGSRAQFQARFRELESILAVRVAALSMIARISVLIGLLGTVYGLIKSFMAIQLTGGQIDPRQLAAGMWEALIVTMVGLSVAVISWVLAFILDSWLDSLINKAEHIVVDHPKLFGVFLDLKKKDGE